MLEQLAFFLGCGAIWAFFHFTSGQQRHRSLQVALWLLLAFGACGFVAEVWFRGGGLPLTW